jgi:thiamine biosynthesis lipoprotein
VTLQQGGAVALRSRALATSAPLGMTFAKDARSSHSLNPVSGRPAVARWQGMSISALTAALADALSTAACLMENNDQIVTLCGRFNGARRESAVLT